MTASINALAAEFAAIRSMTDEQLAAFLAERTAQPKALTLKVSDKGALSVYGLGRFPVTLYRGQWERLAKHMPEIERFIAANAALLAVKA